MKSRILKCITAITLFPALAIMCMKAGKAFPSQYSHIGKRLAGTKLISKGNVACVSTVSDDNE